EARAQFVRDRPEPRRRQADVDDPLERVARRTELALALRGGSNDRRALRLRVAQEREVGFRYRAESEPAPEQVSLRPLYRRARTVREREPERRLEVLGGPLAQLHLDRFFRLR